MNSREDRSRLKTRRLRPRTRKTRNMNVRRGPRLKSRRQGVRIEIRDMGLETKRLEHVKRTLEAQDKGTYGSEHQEWLAAKHQTVFYMASFSK